MFTDSNENVIDYYKIFNLPHNANRDEVRSAFCSLIKIYHPDLSGNTSELDKKKIDLIIKGYKILSDDKLRHDYNQFLLHSNSINEDGFVYLSKKRIKYSFSLKDLLLKRLLNKKMKRKDWIYNLGQDVEIFISKDEAKRGAVAFIELPSRMQCPLCYGENPGCHICYGVGRISGTASLEVAIPPNIANGTKLDFDLMNVRPDSFTSFTMRTLRIKITVMGKSN